LHATFALLSQAGEKLTPEYWPTSSVRYMYVINLDAGDTNSQAPLLLAIFEVVFFQA
jgi:hypothetical protein